MLYVIPIVTNKDIAIGQTQKKIGKESKYITNIKNEGNNEENEEGMLWRHTENSKIAVLFSKCILIQFFSQNTEIAKMDF